MENEIKLEKALDQIEKIVSELESGELSMDEALKRYEEGVKLSRICSQKLSEAEKKIEVLTRRLNEAGEGDLQEEGENQKTPEKKKGKRNASSEKQGADSDFLL